MVIEYLAYQLVDGYKSGDGNVTSFLDHYDFYLVPFHNPDGKHLLSIYTLEDAFKLTHHRLSLHSN